MKLLNKEIICYFDGYNIKDNYDTCVSSYQDDKSFSQNKFEILSEDEEIDIEKDLIELLIEQLTEREHTNADVYMLGKQINILIKAIKQINKQINKQMKEK